MNAELTGQQLSSPLVYEQLNCKEFACRMNLTEAWVRHHVRSIYPPGERIPHLKYGSRVLFEWNCPALLE
jgi:hypothetical protein